MKYVLLLIVMTMSLFSQSAVTVQLDTFSRTVPLIGFNTNAHHSIANWKIPAFRETVATLAPAILRYPGGTVANHWDWKRGWFQNAATTPPEFANINPKDTIRAEEFKLGADMSESEALFVMNFQFSTLEYELEGLRHAKDLGFSVKYIEIGNEHNLSISNQYIPPGTYANGVKTWSDSIKYHFPASEICLVGGAPPATPGWHDSIFVRSPLADALAFHVYLGAGNTDSLFNTSRALSIPFAQLQQRYNQSKFSAAPPNVNVWVTEFNLSESLSGTPTQHAETWTHALYVAAMTHIFLENKKITMIVNHNLTNQLDFAGISPFDFHVTANGIIMKLIGEVSKGMTTATRLSFPLLPSQQFGSTVFPKLIGWKFDDGSDNRGLIVNLSRDTIDLDLQQAFGNSIRVTQYFTDTNAFVSGASSLNQQESTTSNTVSIMPYSVAQLTPTNVTSISRKNSLPEAFSLRQNYPNPFNPTTNISFDLPSAGTVSLTVFDLLGRSISTVLNEFKTGGSYTVEFNGSEFSSGLYLYQLRWNGNVSTKRMLLLK